MTAATGWPTEAVDECRRCRPSRRRSADRYARPAPPPVHRRRTGERPDSTA